MSDFERRLRTALEREVERIDAAPYPGAGRARSRQIVAIGAVVAIAALVVAGIVMVVPGSAPDRTGVVAPAVEDPRGSGGTAPCDHPELKGECVAHGDYDGESWWLGAFVSNRGEICTSEARADRRSFLGGGSSCWEHDPEAIRVAVMSGGGSPLILSQGVVGSHVARLILTRSEGPPIELQLYEAGPDFPLDAKFYNVFLPEDARDLVTYDAAGEELTRFSVRVDRGLHAGDDHHETVTKKRVVAEGEFGGHPWTLTAHEERGDGGIYPCVDLMYGFQEQFGGGGTCAVRGLVERPVHFAESMFEEQPEAVVVFGAVAGRADRVFIELENGVSYEVDLVRPDGFKADVAFFAEWIAEGDPILRGAIVAFDDDGDEIDRVHLCDEVPIGGTCGP